MANIDKSDAARLRARAEEFLGEDSRGGKRRKAVSQDFFKQALNARVISEAEVSKDGNIGIRDVRKFLLQTGDFRQLRPFAERVRDRCAAICAPKSGVAPV